MVSGVKWSVTDIVKIIRERQHNEFDANIAVSGDRGNGKTQVQGELVLMSDGTWKTVENIKVGEEVISPQEDGTFTYEKVIKIHSRFEQNIYDIMEVTRHKRRLYSCSYNHELPVIKRISKRTSKDDLTPRILGRKICIMNAEDLSKRHTQKSHYSSFTSPLIEFKNFKDLEIEPYSLGVFLGNGSFTNSLSIVSDDIEPINEISKYYKVNRISNKEGTTAKGYYFHSTTEFYKLLIKYGLRYKLAATKSIPDGFLNTSVQYRLKLLAGLIDTDGFVSKDNQTTICTKSKQLSKDIYNLVHSLGGYSVIREIYKKCQGMTEKRKYYDIAVMFKDPFIIPLKVPRKLERLRIRVIEPRNVAIKSIKRDKGERVYGFSITGESKWFITSNWMVTHNSTAVFKILSRFDNFNPWIHQVYDRDSVVSLLKTQYLGICWDDEAINSGYKRNFQEKGQQELIKILTAYRDNYNVFASAIPNFFSLDKDLRDLYFVHLHIIERGIAVLHMPLQGRLYSQDRWDAAYNSKVEQGWSKKMMMNPKFRPKYNKLTTFRGYLYFNDITSLQKELYKKIKKEKRKKAFKTDDEVKQEKEKSFIDNVYDLLLQGKLTKEGLVQIALTNGKKYSNLRDLLSKRLINDGQTESLMDLMKQNIVVKHRNIKQLKTLPIS